MKRIKELIRRWDEIEEQIRILRWAQKTFVEAEFEDFVDQVSADLKWVLITQEEKEAWISGPDPEGGE